MPKTYVQNIPEQAFLTLSVTFKCWITSQNIAVILIHILLQLLFVIFFFFFKRCFDPSWVWIRGLEKQLRRLLSAKGFQTGCGSLGGSLMTTLCALPPGGPVGTRRTELCIYRLCQLNCSLCGFCAGLWRANHLNMKWESDRHGGVSRFCKSSHHTLWETLVMRWICVTPLERLRLQPSPRRSAAASRRQANELSSFISYEEIEFWLHGDCVVLIEAIAPVCCMIGLLFFNTAAASKRSCFCQFLGEFGPNGQIWEKMFTVLCFGCCLLLWLLLLFGWMCFLAIQRESHAKSLARLGKRLRRICRIDIELHCIDESTFIPHRGLKD